MNNQINPPRFRSLVDVADYLLQMPDDVKEQFKAEIRKRLAALKRQRALKLVSGRKRD